MYTIDVKRLTPLVAIVFVLALIVPALSAAGAVSTERLKWSYGTAGQGVSSPVVFKDVVYVGSEDGNVYALSATDGSTLWSYQTGAMVTSSPVACSVFTPKAPAHSFCVEGGLVGGGQVHTLNTNGRELWSFAIGPQRFLLFRSGSASSITSYTSAGATAFTH